MYKILFFILVLATFEVYTYPPNEPRGPSAPKSPNGKTNSGFTYMKKMFRNMRFGLSSPAVLISTGKEFCANKEYTDALEFFDKAIRMRPNGETFTARGLCYEQQGRLDLALPDFEEAVRLARNEDKYRRHLIRAYLQHGDWEKAEYETLEFTNTNDIMEAADKLCSQKQYAAAIRCFHKLIMTTPCTLYYTSRAQCRIRMGDLDNARADFDRAAELDPYLSIDGEVEVSRVKYCENLIKFGKLEEAVKEIPALLHHTQLATMGRLLCDQREYEKAIPFYTAAIEKFPNRAEYLRKRGKCYKEIKEFGKALIDFQKVMKLQPGCASSCVDLIETLVEAEKYEDAQNVLKNYGAILSTGLPSEDESKLQAAKNKIFTALEIDNLERLAKKSSPQNDKMAAA